jgi:hypothetical protein
MHTTSQKKKMTIPGIAYPPIVLARTIGPRLPGFAPYIPS